MLIKVNALPPTIEQNDNNNDLYKIKTNNGNNWKTKNKANKNVK